MRARGVVIVCLGLAAMPACKKDQNKERDPGEATLSSVERDILADAKQSKVRLPRTTSESLPPDVTDLTVSMSQLWLRKRPLEVKLLRGRVSAYAKRDGRDGYFISDLFKKLRFEARKLKALDKSTRNTREPRPFGGNLRIAADGKTRFRTLAEILYTANQADFKTYHLVAMNKTRPRVVVIKTPTISRSPLGAKAPPLRLTVRITKAGYLITSRHGPECPGSAPAADGVCWKSPPGAPSPAALRKLNAHLFALFSKKYSAYGQEHPAGKHRIFVIPHPETPLAHLVAVLDAVRDVPSGRGKCRFGFSVRQGKSEADQRTKPDHCMYHAPLLALAPVVATTPKHKDVGGIGFGGFGTPGGKKPKVSLPRGSVRGGLDAATIRRVIRKHLKRVEYCYASIGLIKNPKLAGTVKVSFVIGKEGKVKAAAIASSTLGDPPTEKCVAGVIKRLQFPKPEGPNPFVTYPFRFKPTGD